MRKSSIEKELKEAISRVNDSLFYFELGFVSCDRFPGACNKERCRDIAHFIEMRLNFECAKIPSIESLVLNTDGHVFFCDNVEGFDEKKRRYQKAYCSLLSEDMIENDPSGKVVPELEEFRKALGGRKIVFNGVKRKIKLVVTK